MKYLLFAFALIISSCNYRTNTYHCQVECFVRPGNWIVTFTKNNWSTSDRILDVYASERYIDLLPKIFSSEQQAIDFAIQFKTYDSAVNYNQRQYVLYDSLQRKKAEPPKCDKPINIY